MAKDFRLQVPVHLLFFQESTQNDRTAEDSTLIGQMLQVGKTSAMQSNIHQKSYDYVNRYTHADRVVLNAGIWY